ncbi:hypothetical protein MYX82_13185 [Acidobacteria bacterium AH-259-D05]|nr:hypothetical protein [Acidobacteria bacterium AH-259-D05]
MSRYRKIDPRTWRDEKFRRLDPEGKLIAFYVLTAQSNRIGIFNFSPAMAAEEIGIDPETFAERFGKVCQTLNWEWDESSRVVYLPTWWKYNTPENPNVVIGLLNDVGDIPTTPLLSRFSTNLTYLPENLKETFTQTLSKRYPKPSPNQEQEQEQEKEQEQESPTAAADFLLASQFFSQDPRLKNDPERFLATWKELRPDLDILRQLQSAEAHLLASGKSYKNYAQFLTNWIKRERNGDQSFQKSREQHQSEIEADIERIQREQPHLYGGNK